MNTFNEALLRSQEENRHLRRRIALLEASLESAERQLHYMSGYLMMAWPLKPERWIEYTKALNGGDL